MLWSSRRALLRREVAKAATELRTMKKTEIPAKNPDLKHGVRFGRLQGQTLSNVLGPYTDSISNSTLLARLGALYLKWRQTD